MNLKTWHIPLQLPLLVLVCTFATLMAEQKWPFIHHCFIFDT